MVNNTDITWLVKARSRYWEEPNIGKRYAIFRLIKNRYKEFSGQYTLDAIHDRTGILQSSIKNFEAGILPSGPFEESSLFALVEDLGLNMDHFKIEEKIRKDTDVQATVKKMNEASHEIKKEPKEESSPLVEKEKVKRTNKPKPFNPATNLVIVNHTLESFLVGIVDGEIHIIEDTAKNIKKKGYTWVAPADEIGRGTQLRARSTKIT